MKALVTAGFIFTFSKNCSEDNFGGCGCDLKKFDLQNLRKDDKNTAKLRCSDSVDFGEYINTELFDEFTNGLDVQSYANWHNSRAGKIVS